jgi:hypothetical protein
MTFEKIIKFACGDCEREIQIACSKNTKILAVRCPDCYEKYIKSKS